MGWAQKNWIVKASSKCEDNLMIVKIVPAYPEGCESSMNCDPMI